MKYLIGSVLLWCLIIWGISAILSQDVNDLDNKAFDAWSDASSKLEGNVITDVYVKIAIITSLSDPGTEVWPGIYLAGDTLFTLCKVRVVSINGRAPTPESMRRLKQTRGQVDFTLEKVRREDGQIIAEVVLE